MRMDNNKNLVFTLPVITYQTSVNICKHTVVRKKREREGKRDDR